MESEEVSKDRSFGSWSATRLLGIGVCLDSSYGEYLGEGGIQRWLKSMRGPSWSRCKR